MKTWKFESSNKIVPIFIQIIYFPNKFIITIPSSLLPKNNNNNKSISEFEILKSYESSSRGAINLLSLTQCFTDRSA